MVGASLFCVRAMSDVLVEEEPAAEDDDVDHDDLQDGGTEAVDAGKGQGGTPCRPAVEPRGQGGRDDDDNGLEGRPEAK